MVSMATQAARRREEILKVLGESRELLQAFGVARLSLFGSFARDEGRHDSDVDLFVEFDRPIGLFEFARPQRQLGDVRGHRVDLVTPAALKPQLRDQILTRRLLPLRDWRLCVEDILDGIARIERYVDGLSSEQFRADQKTVDAVVRNLEIIGEAV